MQQTWNETRGNFGIHVRAEPDEHGRWKPAVKVDVAGSDRGWTSLSATFVDADQALTHALLKARAVVARLERAIAKQDYD